MLLHDWSDLDHSVVNGDNDLSLSSYFHFLERFKWMDFPISLPNHPFAMFINVAMSPVDPLFLLRPFTLIAWNAGLLVLCCVSIALLMLHQVEVRFFEPGTNGINY